MAKNELISEWIETTGGPLILTSKKTSETWRSTGTDDYSRACETDDYFERVDRCDGSVLVLGDEPLRTATYLDRSGLPILVRWKWAPSQSAIIEELHCFEQEIFSDPEEKMTVEISGDMVLFDASISQPCSGDSPFLDFSLADGRYEVKTKIWKPNQETALLLHGFFAIT